MERRPVLLDLHVMAMSIVLCTFVALGAIQVGVYQAAQQGAAHLPFGPRLLCASAIIAMPLAVLRGYRRVNSRLGESVEQ